MSSFMELKVFPNIEELNDFAAERFIEIGNQAIEKSGQFIVALAGGSTPKALYQLLASENYKSKIEWSSVFFFFGDERNVLPNDAESNFRMTSENLFEPLELFPQNIFRWETEFEDAAAIANDYETKIVDFFDLHENKFPKFDLILLGMGDDGHTASLFPFTDALNENARIAIENKVEKVETVRLTLTYPTINNAENVFFLVKGADKSETLKQVLEGDFEPLKFPSQNVQPTSGNLLWLVDSEAAKLLENK
jgi:6-phosphogluconolactonase